MGSQRFDLGINFPDSYGSLLQFRASQNPEGLLYRFVGEQRDESVTYGSLDRQARALAERLREAGCKGDRVLLFFRPGLDYLRAFFGCLYAGRIAVPLYPPKANAKVSRVTGAIFDCQPSLVLCDREDHARIEQFMERIGLNSAPVWTLPDTDVEPIGGDEITVSREDIAFLQYTSGSTGDPKGVIVTHDNLFANQRAIQQGFGTTADDLCFNWLPLYHDMGLIGNVLHPLYVGFPSILTSPATFIRDPMMWLEGIDRFGATVAGAPNFAYELLCRKQDPVRLAGLNLNRWRVAYNGAEPIRWQSLQAFAKVFEPYGFSSKAFYPCYGMAEATLFISGTIPGNGVEPTTVHAKRLSEGEAAPDPDGFQLVPCGGVMDGHELCVVDPETSDELSAGRVGELWFRGPSVAKGYWRKEPVNQAVFGAETSQGRGPWLRTGDLGFIHQGQVHITGRLKEVLIVRGRNYYPQDLEQSAELSASLFQPGGAAAFLIEHEQGSRLGLALEVRRTKLGGFSADTAAALVREAVARDHGLQIDRVAFLKPYGLPKTSSGKKRRLATRDALLEDRLPLIAESRERLHDEDPQQVLDLAQAANLSANTMEPATRRAVLQSLVANCMHRHPNALDWNQPLIALGLDSVAAIDIQNTLMTRFQTQLTLSELLDGASLDDLSAKVDQAANQPSPSELRAEPELTIGDWFPLSHNQTALFFIDQLLDGQATPHNLSLAFQVQQTIDPELLCQALERLMALHPILATIYQLVAGEPRQRVCRLLKPDIRVLEDYEDNGEHLTGILRRAAAEPFDLSQGPVFRVFLGRGPASVLLVSIHHIATDFQGLVRMVSDLAECYQNSTLPKPPSTTYRDFVLWQRCRLAEPALDVSRQYWQEQLAGTPTEINLPRDRPRPLNASYRGGHYHLCLEETELTDLENLAKSRQTTLFVVMLAAYLQFLHRLTGESDLVVGTPISQRQRPELVGLVGYLSNMVVLRSRAQASTFVEAIADTHQLVLDALTHGDIPFHSLVQQLQPERTNRHPFFQTAFVLQHTVPEQDMGPFALGMADGQLRLGDWSMDSIPLETTASQFDLTFTFAKTGRGLAGRIDYGTDTLQPETAQQLAQLYRHFTRQLTQNPTAHPRVLPLLPASRRNEILALTDKQISVEAGEQTLHGRFLSIANDYPDRIALRHQGQTMTYASLRHRAEVIAGMLQSQGIGPDHRVGVMCVPSTDMIAAMLAVVQCGATYVPLDPNYPSDRLSYLCRDSRLGLLLTDRLPAVNWDIPVILLDDIINGSGPKFRPLVVHPEQAAYIIYTSGSTGQPKGTVVGHRQVLRLFQSTDHQFGFSNQDVWLLFHSFSFDFSVWEIWGPLLYGGSLVILDRNLVRDPILVAQAICDEQVTVLNQTPSAFYNLIGPLCESARDELKLRWVIFGGEALSPPALQAWFAQVGDQHPRLVNMYGITETTVHVTFRVLGSEEGGRAVSPLGRPIDDLCIRVLDRDLQPVPQGVAGEIFVGGAGLAEGYWGQPGLTATRFIPDPYSQIEPGVRLYRSGDRARLDWRGDLIYLGRLDTQVNLKGYRIELDEIAAALGSHPTVDGAVVLLNQSSTKPVAPVANPFFPENQSDEKGSPTKLRNLLKTDQATAPSNQSQRLVAYFTCHSGMATPSDTELLTYLKERLPGHMVPGHLLHMPEFPLTPHGKLDRKAMPEPDQVRPFLDTPFIAPRTHKERRLAAVWAEVLNLGQVGIDDHFFDLGGDSILSIRLRARAQEEGFDFSLQDLMQRSTVRELAGSGDADREAIPEYQPIDHFALIEDELSTRLPDGVVDAYPLARLQEGLLFHSSFNQDIPMYCDVFLYQFRAVFHEVSFRKALDHLASVHTILRTTFDFDLGTEPLQLVHEQASIPLWVEDLVVIPRSEQRRRLQTWLAMEKRRGYDWTQPPLMRFQIFLLTEDVFVLAMSFHDALMDGWSESSILTQLLETYFDILHHREPQLTAPPLAFRDFIHLERQVLPDPEQWRFWSEELADRETNPLPTLAGKGDPFAEPHMAFLDVPIAPALSEALKTLAKQASTSIKHVLLAAHCRVLAFLTGHLDVCTALESNGRLEIAGGEAVLGCHLNAVPFRMKMSGDQTWLEWIRAIHHQESRLAPYRRFPYAETQHRIGGEPLFDTSFNYTHFHVYRQLSALPGLDILGAKAYIQTHFALRVEFNQDPFSGNLSLDLEADEQRLSHEQLQQIAVMFGKVLTSMTATPQSTIGTHCLLPDKVRRTLLQEWNPTATTDVPDLSHLAIQGWADRVPTRVAIREADASVTYGTLTRRANHLAGILAQSGIGSESLVAILADRGIDYVTIVLALFKAGAGYLPVAGKPTKRAARVLDRAMADAVICHRANTDQARAICAAQATASPTLFIYEDLLESEAVLPFPQWTDDPQRLANVFFTSGSTGEPKGAVISHLGMANHLRSKIKMLALSEGDRVSQDAAQTFDISVWQMMAALMVGGEVFVFADEVAKDPLRLFHEVANRGITILEVSPAVLGVFVEEAERLGDTRPPLNHLRYLPCSGEALPPDLCRRWLTLYPHIPLINMWGATECSDDVSWVKQVTPPEDQVTIMPLGHPIEQVQILLLDPFMQLAPPASPGELFIGGTAVGRGYRRDPIRTALAFLPNPFGGIEEGMDAGSRLYRTGDLGRFRADGQAEFLGRRDHQIKIRGFRVELGEIEAALNRIPEISQVLVIVAKDRRGDKFLAAYLLIQAPLQSEDLDLDQVRRTLATSLPAYMIPTSFTVLPTFPLNANGKIDRKALPDPIMEHETARTGEPPRGDTEQRLAAIWSDILAVPIQDRELDFFQLGGHSLLATRVASRIRESFAIELGIRTLFEKTSLAQLAETIDQSRGKTTTALEQEPPLVAVPDREQYPLSFAQQRLWILDQLEGEHGTYNMASRLQLRGPLSLTAIVQALNSIIARHETLRTVFQVHADQVTQKVLKTRPVVPRFLDLRNLDEDIRPAYVAGTIRDAARRRLNLAKGPLLDITFLRFAADDHLMLITMHHIISDGWSGGVMIRELAAHYFACLTGNQLTMPPLSLQYRDFAIWQKEWFAGPIRERQLSYWLDQLADCPPLLDLPTDFPRPPIQSFQGSELRFEIDAGTLGPLTRFAEGEGMSLFMVLHGALALLLHHYSGQRDVVIGSPVANRDRRDIEPLIGFFVNSLVLRTLIDPDQSIAAFLQQVRETDLQAYAHQHLPFEQLVEAIQPERNPSYNPVFQVMLVLQNAANVPFDLPGLQLAYTLTKSETSKFDMLLSIEEKAGVLAVTWEYATDLFSQDTIRDMANHFSDILARIPASLDRPLSQFSPVNTKQSRQLLHDYNDHQVDLDHSIIHHIFQAQVDRSPHAVAVQDDLQSLTYEELDQQSSRLAIILRQAGITDDQLVGFAVERSVAMAVGMLGILKSGAAYLPLDPHYPSQRLATMVEDAQIPLILTQRALSDCFPSEVSHLYIDELPEPAAHPSMDSRATITIDPQQLVYGIYTSGSTGKPKCTLMSHMALANMIQFFARDVSVQDDCTFAFASLSFDVHLMEFFGAWALGHRIVVVPETLRRDPEKLLDFTRTHRISRVILPVVVLQAWAELFERNGRSEAFSHLAHIGSTGEQLVLSESIRSLFQAHPHLRLSNYYGPTETHVITAYSLPAAVESWPRHAPIGRTLPNTQTYLLNQGLMPVPRGARGSLLSGGINLARGYHRRPTLTASKFLPDPYSDVPGSRMYVTGDLARYGHPTGQDVPPLHYLGRHDHMIKLRGFRVELGEIESALHRWEGMTFVHVALRRIHGTPQLVAYLRLPLPYPRPSEFKQFLAKSLPDHMVPDHFVLLDDLPLSPNGKVAYRRLPEPTIDPEQVAALDEATLSAAERWFVRQFTALLGQPPHHLDQGLFELGGHSITATQLANRVAEGLALVLPPRQLFTSSSINGLIDFLSDQVGSRTQLDRIAALAEEIAAMSDTEVTQALEGTTP